MKPEDMTPLLPFSVWKTGKYSIVLVLDSCVLPNKNWEICIRTRDDDAFILEYDPMEWMRNAEFICESCDLQIYNEDLEDEDG